MCHLMPLRGITICLSARNRQMGTGMDSTAPNTASVIARPVSIVRLHGEACFYCGAVTPTLYAAGHITLLGTNRVWPIVTCGCNQTAVTA